jgi:hypothetical protein
LSVSARYSRDQPSGPLESARRGKGQRVTEWTRLLAKLNGLEEKNNLKFYLFIIKDRSVIKYIHCEEVW